MKRIILVGLFLFIGFTSFSQIFIKGRNLNEEKDLQYISVFKDLGNWKIDTGENNNLMSKNRILNSKGLKMKFSTPTELFNYFYQNGWEYISDSDLKGFSKIHFYVFKRI